MHPLVPRFGGTRSTGTTLAEPFTLIVKVPLPLFLICAVFTGPCSPLESLYLKPLTGSPVQYGLPVTIDVPWASPKVCSDGLSPAARIVSVAPSATGFPTIVFALVFSFALPTKLRFSGTLGFLTRSWSPRIV
jgi:hypothetical protein